MEYNNIPQSLIYKHRDNLNDFGVQNPGTINHYLFSQMRKLTLLHCGNAKEIALQCFNNAYYICTLIQLDEFPDLSMDKYEAALLSVEIPFREDAYQASMALVCVLLAAYDDQYKQEDNLLIKSIHHWTSSNKWTGSLYHKSFEDIINTCSTEGYALPKSEFEPRDIIEVIDTSIERYLWEYAEYICERLARLNEPRQRVYGTDLAIARLKDYQRELCKESDYNPKKDCFNYKNGGGLYSPSDFDYEEQVRGYYQQSKEAIAYYTEHYPKADNNHQEQNADSTIPTSDNAVLIAENEQLKQLLSKRDQEVNKLGTQNAELEKNNKALKYQLANSSSISDEKLEKLKAEWEHNKAELEAEVERLKREQEDMLVELLKPAFYNIEDDARDFLKRIRGLDSMGVVTVARQFAKNKKIVDRHKKTFIWRILKAAKLYEKCEQNWGQQMNIKE